MEKLRFKGYYFRQINQSVFEIECPDESIRARGEFKDAVRVALKLGIVFGDLEQAVQNFVRDNHNEAHFGAFGGLLFTHKKNID